MVRRIPAVNRMLVGVLVVASLGLGAGVAQAVDHALSARVVAPRVSGPWTCTTGSLFESVKGQVAVSNYPTGWRTIGSGPDSLNALAYSPITKYLYAIDSQIGPRLSHLIRIGNRGDQTDLGAVVGMPSQVIWKAGDIDPATGTFFVSTGGLRLYAIDITTLHATPVALPYKTSMGYDLVVQKGWLWTVNTDSIDGFSLTTGSTKSFSIPLSLRGDAAGSIWADPAADALYYRWDAGGKIYHVTGLRTSSLGITLIGTASRQGVSNDGATCNAHAAPGPDTAPVLGISANLTSGFVPGQSQKVNLVLTNSFSTPVTVWGRVVKLVVGDSSLACPAASNFNVDQGLTVPVTVPANSTKTLSQLGVPRTAWPVIRMIETRTNQNACEGTTLSISYFVRYYR